jgi:hypothetical protein
MAENELGELFDFLEDDGLTTPPVKGKKYPEGKVYVIPSPDAETGARLTALGELGVKLEKGLEVTENDMKRLRLNDAEEREFAEQVLGSALPELFEDGVSWVIIQRLTKFAFVHFSISPEAAREAAQRGVFSGKALARNRAQRRADARSGAAHKAPQGSTDLRV